MQLISIQQLYLCISISSVFSNNFANFAPSDNGFSFSFIAFISLLYVYNLNTFLFLSFLIFKKNLENIPPLALKIKFEEISISNKILFFEYKYEYLKIIFYVGFRNYYIIFFNFYLKFEAKPLCSLDE